MDENQNSNQSDNSNDLKNETINTVKNVKDTVKNINFKEETQKSKSYLKDLVQDPTGKVEAISKDTENTCFKTAIFALIIWSAVELIIPTYVYLKIGFSYMMKNILDILLLTLTPAISILTLSVIAFLMNKENKKSLVTVITTMITAKLPVILANILGLLTLISSSASRLVSPISGFLNVISTILIFFSIKNLFESEDNNETIKKFAIVMGIFYIAKFLFTFLGITI